MALQTLQVNALKKAIAALEAAFGPEEDMIITLKAKLHGRRAAPVPVQRVAPSPNANVKGGK